LIEFDKFNESALVMNSLGFSFDAEPVKTEVAACMNVSKEYCYLIESGLVDPDEYIPKALAKYKAFGLLKIQAEMQRQYDKWICQ
jgi:putative aldouronate transport system substrate-binding protein